MATTRNGIQHTHLHMLDLTSKHPQQMPALYDSSSSPAICREKVHNAVMVMSVYQPQTGQPACAGPKRTSIPQSRMYAHRHTMPGGPATTSQHV